MTKPRKLTPEQEEDVAALERAAMTLLLLTRELKGPAAEQAKATARHLQTMSRRMTAPRKERTLQ